jgi:hypothetical protein
MCEDKEEFLGITFEELEELKPLLSVTSYENLKKAVKTHQTSPPPLKGNGVYVCTITNIGR